MSDMTTREPVTGSADRNETRGDDRARDRSAFNFNRPHGDESIPALVQRLAEQGSHLAQEQLKLVESEVRSGVDDIKESAGAMAGAAVLGIAGIGVVLMGVSFVLAQIMPLWLATLIVGVAALIGAYAMFAGARRKLQSGSLGVERTRRTLERAPSAISGNSNESRSNDR